MGPKRSSGSKSSVQKPKRGSSVKMSKLKPSQEDVDLIKAVFASQQAEAEDAAPKKEGEPKGSKKPESGAVTPMKEGEPKGPKKPDSGAATPRSKKPDSGAATPRSIKPGSGAATPRKEGAPKGSKVESGAATPRKEGVPEGSKQLQAEAAAPKKEGEQKGKDEGGKDTGKDKDKGGKDGDSKGTDDGKKDAEKDKDKGGKDAEKDKDKGGKDAGKDKDKGGKDAEPKGQTSTRSDDDPSTLVSATTVVSKQGGKGAGDDERLLAGHYIYRVYRTEALAGDAIIYGLRTHWPWPPRSYWFDSSGYYKDMAVAHFEPDEVRFGVPLNEIWIYGSEDAISEDTINRLFPGHENAHMQMDSDGFPIVVVQFKDPKERDREFERSILRKIGPNKLDWVLPDQVKVENLPPTATEKDLEPFFPTQLDIEMKPLQGEALIHFRSESDANRAYKDNRFKKEFLDLGNRALAWINPNENYTTGIPLAPTRDDVTKVFPDASNIQWLKYADGTRVAVTVHKDPNAREQSYNNAPIPKRGDQRLCWRKGGVDAKVEAPSTHEIWIPNLEPNVRVDDIKKNFPNAKTIEIRKGKNGQPEAILKYDQKVIRDLDYKNTALKKEGTGLIAWVQPNEIKLVNIPPGTTEAEIRKRFPTVKEVKLRPEGQAVLSFQTPKDAEEAAKDSPGILNLGNRGVAWIAPNENYVKHVPPGITTRDINDIFPNITQVKWIPTEDGTRAAICVHKDPAAREKAYNASPFAKEGNQQMEFPKEMAAKGEVPDDEIVVSGLDPNTTVEDVQKMFPNATDVTIRKGLDGLPVAYLKYERPALRDKDFEKTTLKQDGPGKIAWIKPTECKLVNLPEDITEAAVKKKFPTAKSIKLKKNGQAVISFETPKDAENASKNSPSLVNLGNRGLAWIGPEENYITQVPPEVTGKDIQRIFPDANQVKWLNHVDGSRVAVLTHNDPKAREKAFKNSPFAKTGNQQLEFPKDIPADMKAAAAPVHNGEVPSDEIVVSGLDPSITEADIRKKFPKAAEVAIKMGEDGQPAAFLKYINPADREKDFKDTDLKAEAPGKIAWIQPNEVKMVNLPPDITEAQIKEKFPAVKTIKLKPNGQAVLSYNSPKDAEDSCKDTKGAVGLGNRGLAWIGPTENYITKIPPGVTSRDIANIFPTAQEVKWMDHVDGSRVAVVVHKDAKAREKAFNDSPMAKTGDQQMAFPTEKEATAVPPKQLKGAVPKNEIWLPNLDENVTVADIKKRFPKAKNITIKPGEDGKPVAFLKYKNKAERDQELKKTPLRQIEPNKLDWLFPDEITIENLPPDITQEDLLTKFPEVTTVTLKPDGKAVLKYKSPAEATAAYKANKELLDLGNRQLAWMNPNENYLTGTPKMLIDADVKEIFVNTEEVKWLPTKSGQRVAVAVHKDKETKDETAASVDLPKDKKIKDAFQFKKGAVSEEPVEKDITDEEASKMNVEELAEAYWGKPKLGYTNISNLFKPTLYIRKCPPGMTRTKLLKIFPGCSKVEIKNQTAIAEFDAPEKAAAAYLSARKSKFENKRLMVTLHKPPELKKKKKGGKGKKSQVMKKGGQGGRGQRKSLAGSKASSKSSKKPTKSSKASVKSRASKSSKGSVKSVKSARKSRKK